MILKYHLKMQEQSHQKKWTLYRETWASRYLIRSRIIAECIMCQKGMLERLSDKPDCFRIAAKNIRSQCTETDMHEDQRVMSWCLHSKSHRIYSSVSSVYLDDALRNRNGKSLFNTSGVSEFLFFWTSIVTDTREW